MQLADIDYKPAGKIDLPGYKPTLKGHKKQILSAAKAIAAAEKPVLYAGGGIITAGAEKELLAIAKLMKIPVTTTLMGLGCFPENNDLSLGMLGMHGTGYANYAVTHSDLLIGVGARFDDRVTGKLATFARHAKKIHIDMDPAEISKNVAIDIPIVGDAKDVLAGILAELKKMKREPKKTAAWLDQVIAWKKKHPLHYKDEKGSIMPQYVIEEVNRITKSDAILCTDVGQHQMWSALFYTAYQAAALDQFRRPGDDGLRFSGGHRRQGRLPRQDRHRHRRRRQLPDEHPGAGDSRLLQHPGGRLYPQQRFSGDGPAVAGTVLEQALFGDGHILPA